MNNVDRLGEALRQIARGMADSATGRVRMTIVIGDVEAIYEVKLVRAQTRTGRRHVRSYVKHGRRHVFP